MQELFPHHVGAAHLTVQHGLVYHRVDERGGISGEDLLTCQPCRQKVLQLILGRVGLLAEHRTRILGSLEQARHQARREDAQDPGGALVRDERAVGLGKRQVPKPLLHHLEHLRVPEELVSRFRELGLGDAVVALDGTDERPGVPELRPQLVTGQPRLVAGLPPPPPRHRKRPSLLLSPRSPRPPPPTRSPPLIPPPPPPS